MVYRNNFIAVIKCNNKVLREQYDKDHDENVVFIPFNEEYSILLKNKDSRRACVSIEIDGECITNAGDIIVPANGEVTLERFLDDLNSGNKFKFLKKIKEIVEHRGDRVDDGIIRIEYWYEKDMPWKITTSDYTYKSAKYPWEYDRIGKGLLDNSSKPVRYGEYTTSNIDSTFYSSNLNISSMSMACSAPASETCVDYGNEGITGKGEISNQKFSSVYGFLKDDTSSVICIKLRGSTDKHEYIKTPITVETKIKCNMCGKTHKSYIRFCGRCGNFLK